MSRDVESGETNLHQMKMVYDENPELRWSFIRKVYSIITFQLLLTIAVISVVLFVHPITNFFDSKQGTVLYKVLIIVPLIALCSLHDKHLLNYFILLFVNVSLALPVGLTWVFAGGKISLEIVILMTIMMFILILYTFYAAKESHDLSLLSSFLYGSFSILILLSLIEILFPLGISLEKLTHIYGCLVSILFCGFIISCTNCLIKVLTYNQHIMAFAIMYICVITLFFIPLFMYCYILRSIVV